MLHLIHKLRFKSLRELINFRNHVRKRYHFVDHSETSHLASRLKTHRLFL